MLIEFCRCKEWNNIIDTFAYSETQTIIQTEDRRQEEKKFMFLFLSLMFLFHHHHHIFPNSFLLWAAAATTILPITREREGVTWLDAKFI